MSYTPPKVYISATTADLRSVRAAITEALNSIGCVPVEVATVESDSATVGAMLREKIESCQALIHIAGARYGPEPDPATLPAGAPRRSYAQMEYHIGCEVGDQRGDGAFQVYVFVCPEDFPYDPAPGIEIAEKWALQDAHRNQLPKSAFFCGSPENAEDMRAWAIGLQEQFPPPPPPPPAPTPPLPPPSNATPAGESFPVPAPVPSEMPPSPNPQGGSRLLLVLGILAALGLVAILGAAWMLHQKGFFGRKVVVQKAPEIKTASTGKTDPVTSAIPKSSPSPPKTIQTPPPSQPKPPSAPSTLPTAPPVVAKNSTPPPPPAPVVAKQSAPPPSPTPVVAKPSAPSPAPASTSPAAPSPAPPHPQTRAIDLVRSAALAMNPASRITAAAIGNLYVDQPVLNGKTYTRADVVRQVEQFRRTWDTQAYDVIEGPTVTSGEGTNHVSVKVKTRFSGVRKTGIKFTTVTTASEYVVIVGADGTPLIESQRELSQE